MLVCIYISFFVSYFYIFILFVTTSGLIPGLEAIIMHYRLFAMKNNNNINIIMIIYNNNGNERHSTSNNNDCGVHYAVYICVLAAAIAVIIISR